MTANLKVPYRGFRGLAPCGLYLVPLLLLPLLSTGQEQSPYIWKVFEYRPAPGQFVNELPEYEVGDTPAEMALKAEECIKGETKTLVSLGGYGGYIVFGFDHMIENIEGKKDFRILSNAFYTNANPNPDALSEGGSSEPGIVMVSYDANGNGLPDDPWYELAGSEYNKPETIKNYRIMYYKPDESKIRTPDSSYIYLSDTTYILWKSNQGDQGYLYRNTFHSQSYYPQWLDEDSLVFTGTKLANNYIDESGDGSYYVQYAYDWGYADNHHNADNRSCFDINWAVDSLGNSVSLPGINFVKVYTGVNQYCGWLGESSTEILGAEDLHMTGTYVGVSKPENKATFSVYPNPVKSNLHIVSELPQKVEIFNLKGTKINEYSLIRGHNVIDVTGLFNGVYILKANGTIKKIIKSK
ncbi:T9SS type A sorting domain-containing protein [Bacteroidales bacterium OttesenSCG-928-C19]|nr:T9SS type A sorting domain-containing protein [Bacteroidales bacterium OttesenSCG-928-C19]